ncbi:type I phosphomannose isomerase catalytic subunit [Leptospira alstonii]|uniref:Phosphomannose isomerase type I-like protein n=2 Tax=Leptospira alstonii TaxID=28452 RepID=M6D2Z4_9LEPT|nr:type I phosphomannose isomerase catalytic subunit [Leptospira alstonii]EMJ98339.1 phosphomannose isomerase type I-like protein [Leptospira alstonii serovar Sichuan str. 79601]EQA82300.1 phosphomannose isomerase type I-like protein [Leptospira alstonii serovar Pingchang str. 80-412]
MQKVIRFHPIYKERIWGGRKLGDFPGRKIPEGNIGESWEVSDYGNEVSVIANGPLAGKSFRTAYLENTDSILGKPFRGKPFPLLIKIIDAKEKLSVQVHPDDLYAEKYDPRSAGKKEAWIVLRAEPGSQLICGFSNATNREEFKTLVEQNRAEAVLRRIAVREGDAFLLNPGKIHAIGEGILLMEVQQSSDSTYRVYDYGRPRELHLEKALDVLDYGGPNEDDVMKPAPKPWDEGKRFRLTANDKFLMETLEISGKEKIFQIPNVYEESVFRILIVLSGSVEVEGEVLSQGDTLFLTASGLREGIFATNKSDLTKLSVSGPGSDWAIYKD